MSTAKTYEAKIGRAAFVTNPNARSPVVLICEHASNFIPDNYVGLGLSAPAQNSHVAWDPGAFPVSARLSDLMDAQLVYGGVSRLIYDCNRPPDAPDAMPQKSEIYDIPGNINLDGAEKLHRVKTYFGPFRSAVNDAMNRVSQPVIVTIHSFTPVYMGQKRTFDIGVLHDSDNRLADALLHLAPDQTSHNVKRNQPYGPVDGVTHTLKHHAVRHGHLNVMLEIRNDIIATEDQQEQMAECLCSWLTAALGTLNVNLPARDAPCTD